MMQSARPMKVTEGRVALINGLGWKEGWFKKPRCWSIKQDPKKLLILKFY